MSRIPAAPKGLDGEVLCVLFPGAKRKFRRILSLIRYDIG